MQETAVNTFITVELVAVTCYKCGTAFGIARRLYQELRTTHNDFFCPSGHPQCFLAETELERTKKLLDERTKRMVDAERDAYKARDQARTAQRTARAANTRRKNVEKRVKNGVCPCCKRTFQNLMMHMATKHKGFAK